VNLSRWSQGYYLGGLAVIDDGEKENVPFWGEIIEAAPVMVLGPPFVFWTEHLSGCARKAPPGLGLGVAAW